MKSLLNNSTTKLVAAVVLGTASAGWATVIPFTGGGGNFTAVSSGAQGIPDYPSSGIGQTLNFDFSDYDQLTGITVTFTTTGGWNGDLYAYLSHGSDLAILLNRVGASGTDADGYGTSGFNNITLGMTATTDIHGVLAPTTAGGPYAADGRLTYTDTDRNNTLTVFNGVNPNGDWTLYFEDASALNTSTLSSWSVNVTALPEPTTWALIAFGTVFGAVQLGRQYRRRLAACGGLPGVKTRGQRNPCERN